ncbi:potassium voltage-gated channel subfamily A member 6-like [Rhopilema esculentum]|uniref:potassium voltage-gated channel subfamily A member 6-like n=1 Tax=Rhopilema esculentum TaxID=499914 RepID=UPI0031D9B55E
MEPDWQADMYPEVFLSERADERVCINISGAHFETFESTLARYPNTLLGSPSRRNKYFDPFRGEYFFDRNRRAFDAILFYYQSNGRISKPDNITEKQFVSELSFFEIGKKEDLLTFPERVDRFILAESHELPKNRLKRIFWQLFSSPDSSIFAKIITIIGIFALALSIVITCAETLPSLMHPKSEGYIKVKQIIYVMNHGCYVWFTIEFFVRFLSCSNKMQFFKSPLNWIDLLAIIPFYLQLIIESQTQMTPLSILKAFRIFRIARILKVSRYSRGMRALIYTLFASRHELGLLFFILIIATVVSAALTYYAEINEPDSFLHTIPDALWWSINTITTVGYGDSYPVTTFGKALGGFFSIFGTILIGLPIFCLVSNFLELWDSIRDKSSEDENGTALKTATNIPAVQNYAQIEKKSPYLERRSPYLEKRSPYLERRSSYLELQY